MKFIKKYLTMFFVFMLVLFSSKIVLATITYEFYGVINLVYSYETGVFDGIDIGDSFRYGLIVDQTVLDTYDDPNVGLYDAIVKMYLDIDGSRYLEANRGYISIVNNRYYNTTWNYIDAFQPYIDDSSYFTLNNFSLAPYSSQLNLWQSDSVEPTVLSSDDLPLSALDPSVFNMHRSFNLDMITTDQDGYEVHPSLTGYISDSAFFHTTVPEPSTMLMLGIGLVGLAGLRRARRS